MTPQFTTPCYVQVDDKNKRNEVCDKLITIGYYVGQAYIDVCDEVIITYPESGTFCTGSVGQFDEIDLKGCIDCGTNESLFLVLSGMRSDTDKGQWFIHKDTKMLYQCVQTYIEHFFPRWHHKYRRATVQEIINHFKSLEK